MTTLALVLIAAASLALLWGARGAARAFLDEIRLIRVHLKSLAESPEGQFSTRLAALEHSVEMLPQRWEEFKNEARRAEGRARALIKSAREELERLGFEHDGLSEQGRELRLVDGDASGAEPVPTVHQDMESDPPVDADGLEYARRRKYGA